MAGAHSYKSTLKNNKTESEAVLYMAEKEPSFLPMTKESRKIVLEKLGLPKKFSRTFDLVVLKGRSGGKTIQNAAPKDIVLVEMKTTKKKLMTMPNGFFFGATKNEFDLAKKMGDKYLFCFVSLHPESRLHVHLTLSELESRIKTKRVQYQINL